MLSIIILKRGDNDDAKVLKTIKELTEINSPSGNATEAINYVKNKVEALGYDTKTTNKGALIIEVQGENDEQQRCITAHVDTLGAMVKEIKEDGRLSISLIGGFTYNAIEGSIVKYKLIQDKYIQERFVCMKQVSMFTEIIMKYLEMANIWKFVSMKKQRPIKRQEI